MVDVATSRSTTVTPKLVRLTEMRTATSQNGPPAARPMAGNGRRTRCPLYRSGHLRSIIIQHRPSNTAMYTMVNGSTLISSTPLISPVCSSAYGSGIVNSTPVKMKKLVDSTPRPLASAPSLLVARGSSNADVSCTDVEGRSDASLALIVQIVPDFLLY